ncbi:MAG: hypothetical protein V3S79_01800 [Candidatus Thermoplasmatota archaeon]
MLKINKSKYKVKNSSELEIFLSTGMEVFSSQNVQKQNTNKKIKNKKSNTGEKIDELIANYEKTVENNQNFDKQEKKDTKPYLEFIEIRKSIEKKPQTTDLNTEKKIFENELHKKSIEDTKEITFNIKEDKSNTKELTFNVSKRDDKIQKIEERDKKKNNKKRFFLFKSKKNKNGETEKTQDLRNEKINSKKNKKSNKKINDYEKTKKQKDHKNKNDGEIIEEEKTFFDEDIKKVLLITDNLLEKLPEEIINEFIKSKDFELYERVINKIK